MKKNLILLVLTVIIASGNMLQAAEEKAPFYGVYGWSSQFSKKADLVQKAGFKAVTMLLSARNTNAENDVKAASINGIAINGVLNPGSNPTPEEIAKYREDVKNIVMRFGPKGSFWKDNRDVPYNPVKYYVIGWEDNTDLGARCPKDLSPAKYFFEYLKNGYEVIKQIDPSLKVIGIGPAVYQYGLPSANYVDDNRKIQGWLAYMKEIHDLGGNKYYDILSLHPLPGALPPDVNCLPEVLKTCREEMKRAGEEKPIWFSEGGYATNYGQGNPFCVSLDQQADYTLRLYALAARHNVQQFTMTYVEDQVSGTTYKGYGLFSYAGEWRPVALAMKVMSDLIPNPEILEIISDGSEPDDLYDKFQMKSDKFAKGESKANPYYAYKFRGRNDSEVIMLWTVERPFKVNLKVKTPKVAFYNREFLQGLVYTASEKQISVVVSGIPCFISTEVTPETEEKSKNFLTGFKWNDYRGILPGINDNAKQKIGYPTLLPFLLNLF